MNRGLKPRPILELPRSGVERALEGASIVGLLACFGVVAWFWARLPGRVPMHFNAAGRVDGWGPKASLLAVPAVAAGIYLGLTVLGRFPHLYNYPWPITPDNAERQYRLARLLTVSLKLNVIVIFLDLTLVICRAARGQGALGSWFLPVAVGAVFAGLGTYIAAAYRAR
jgi:hypothetical protein